MRGDGAPTAAFYDFAKAVPRGGPTARRPGPMASRFAACRVMGRVSGVTPTVPVIYARNLAPSPLTVPGRAIALAVAAACLAVLVVAARLEPDASGIGSHRSL